MNSVNIQLLVIFIHIGYELTKLEFEKTKYNIFSVRI
jgi:hypothetical protein